MALRVLRASIPIVLLLAGMASIVAGVMFNSHDVLAQIEDRQAAPKDMPGGPRPPWMQQAPPMEQGPRYVATWLEEGEPQLIKEVSVGGVVLGEDGKLQRTYKGLDIPSLCPT